MLKSLQCVRRTQVLPEHERRDNLADNEQQRLVMSGRAGQWDELVSK